MQLRPWQALLGVVVVAGVTWFLTQWSGSRRASDPANDVLAVVGGMEITRGEVEAANPQFGQLRQSLHELTEQTVETVIRERLVDLEATTRGIDRDSLFTEEIEAKLPEPTEMQIDSVYEVFRDRLGVPRDSVADRIRDFLKGRSREALMESFVGSLQAKHAVANYVQPRRLEVAAIGPAKGPETAPVTIVEFGDFECPFCFRVLDALAQVEQTYGDQVRIVYRQFPLRAIHPNAQKAAEASLCADQQGRFWELHDLMFENQQALGVNDLKEAASSLGLDREAFDACLDSGSTQEQVAADLEDGRKLGVTGTPALFINGRYLSGAQPFNVIARIVDDELRRAST